MFREPTDKLRAELLGLHGVGPETADSILLYAGNHPVFVVDAYTRRLMVRHKLARSNTPYDDIRRLFESALANEPTPDAVNKGAAASASPGGACHPPSPMSLAERTPLVQAFNEMHGLVVGVGKNYCLKSKPRCEQCPLAKFLPLSGRNDALSR